MNRIIELTNELLQLLEKNGFDIRTENDGQAKVCIWIHDDIVELDIGKGMHDIKFKLREEVVDGN